MERKKKRGKLLGGSSWEEVPGKREELGIHILGPRVLSPWDVGPSDFVFLAPIWSSSISKQAVAPSEPNFWTHSLQIHCNGSVGPRSHSLTGPVRKSWPYTKFLFLFLFLFFCFFFLCACKSMCFYLKLCIKKKKNTKIQLNKIVYIWNSKFWLNKNWL